MFLPKRHTPTKLLTSGVALALVGFLIWAFCSRVHFAIEYLEGASVVWHDDEAFIFVGRSISGKSPSPLGVTLESVGLGWSTPEVLQQDMVVFHLAEDRLDKYEFHGFGTGGTAFPYHGQLYFARGGDSRDWPYVWNWTGTNLTRLSKADALGIYSQFQYTSDQLKKEGWQELSLAFYTRNTSYDIRLKNRTITLVTGAEPACEVVMVGRLGNNSRESLIECDKLQYRWVSGSRYQQLRARRPDVSQN